MSDQEAIILENISDLHSAMYDLLAGITGIDGLIVLGFDSSKTNPVLPNIGIKISLSNMEIDRQRPGPLEGTRLQVETGTLTDYTVEGELVEDVYPEREFQHPLPLKLEYSIHSWCYSSETQLAIDQKLMQLLPERGVLTLNIGEVTAEFPITLKDIKSLDDLTQNLREKVYIYSIEAYTRSWIEDRSTKIITTIVEQLKSGEPAEYSDIEEITYGVDE